MSYEQAMEDVQARVAQSRTSFAAGMGVLPKARREAMYALYAFCREVDDIADDSPTPEVAAKGLALWRGRIADLFKGRASDSITAALLPAIKDFDLVEADFQAIIDGMEMDSVVICAPDEATFDLYCDRVASAVGRASVRIFGDASAKAMEVAHHLGRALQITNILRDMAEDATRGRLYLPEELLAKHGFSSPKFIRQDHPDSPPLAGGVQKDSALYTPHLTSPARGEELVRVSRQLNPAEIVRDIRLPAVARDLAERAKGHFQGADQAMAVCLPAAMRPARVMRAYYGAILDRLLKADWQNPLQRVSLPAWQKAWLAFRYGVL